MAYDDIDTCMYIYVHCMYQTYSFAEAIKRRILRYGVPQRGEAPLIYSNHILSYDRSKRTPVWVAERITQDQTQGNDSSRLSPLRSVCLSSLFLFLSLPRDLCLPPLSLSLSICVCLSFLSLNLSSSNSPFRSVSVSLLSLSFNLFLSLFSLSLS